MTARECLQILREIKDVAFATADENGMPHNRRSRMWHLPLQMRTGCPITGSLM